MFRNVRALALALVLVLVSASAVQARPLSSSPEGNVVDRLLNWIGTLITPAITSAWGKAGSDMDPNGQPQNNYPPAPTSDEGSQMDPNG